MTTERGPFFDRSQPREIHSFIRQPVGNSVIPHLPLPSPQLASPMPEKKIIAVVGATGAQGGGLVRAIMNDPSGGFTARAITRDINSEKAKALKALGAEVVNGDVDDEASLKRAFTGAYGAFCVTFFWAHLSPEKEIVEA